MSAKSNLFPIGDVQTLCGCRNTTLQIDVYQDFIPRLVAHVIQNCVDLVGTDESRQGELDRLFRAGPSDGEKHPPQSVARRGCRSCRSCGQENGFRKRRETARKIG